MPISYRNKFIFIKINKTAGTSIQSCINESVEDLQETGHRILRDYKVNYQDFFKFTFVRNPWDKMVSFYHFHRYRRFDLLPSNKKPSFKEFITTEMHNLEFTKHQGKSSRSFRMSNQLDWISDHNGKIAIDFIGRYETLQSDFELVCDALQIPRKILPHKVKSRHKSYREYYDAQTQEIVCQRFRKDIEYFKYEF
ncbi:Sulfotransferase family [Xenococcus sp. PCC 7305]|uniref:sulfotransferase family 2 domain-containing protein n=1 Tax=Xenococcus sp. PCC 7305 TaxID=102125 RepID=UPI0002AC9FBA|nr:sulfotransferase family 2 domain-containing protein [Xenococcus sp. PCC 7305]ELS03908.1 Sulfotransferase family [Xenococcus sp. PCC 7305]